MILTLCDICGEDVGTAAVRVTVTQDSVCKVVDTWHELSSRTYPQTRIFHLHDKCTPEFSVRFRMKVGDEFALSGVTP